MSNNATQAAPKAPSADEAEDALRREREELDNFFDSQAAAQKKTAETLKYEMLAMVRDKQGEHGVGNVRGVLAKTGFVVVKKPHVAHFREFTDSKEHNSEDQLRLVRPCVLSSRDGFEKLIKEEPGVLLAVAGAVINLGGANAKDVLGKRVD